MDEVFGTYRLRAAVWRNRAQRHRSPTVGQRASSRSATGSLPPHRQRRGSTLRLTLGACSRADLGSSSVVLGGRRLTFAGRRGCLAWMADNTHVTWVETDHPWLAEQQLIASANPPLNLDQNRPPGSSATHQGQSRCPNDCARTADRVDLIRQPPPQRYHTSPLEDGRWSFPWSFRLP